MTKLAIQQALLDWNPWLIGEFPMELAGIPRDYDLLPYLEVPEVKIIAGARRVGKSTLLYQLIYHLISKEKKKNILYINFEDEILKAYSLSDIMEAYSETIDYLFVDEIQNCIDWVSFVRKQHDRQEISQIWVSGSNSSLIKQEYATLLTGRNLTIHIEPLSFHEFLNFNDIHITSSLISKKTQIQINALFLAYLEQGGFPAVVKRQVLKKELLSNYFEDFIYKDIASRYDVNVQKVKDLAIYLATNSTKIFSYRKIAAALNCHANTITDYFHYLKECFLYEELYKFDYSLKKQFSNEKKVYCIDTGLAAAVSFRFSEDKGRMLENIVYRELRRRKQEIYFHKEKYECDFIIKQALEITSAIQVCFSLEDAETRQREIQGLVEALQTYHLTEGLILTSEESEEEKITLANVTYTIHIQPIWKWLLFPEKS